VKPKENEHNNKPFVIDNDTMTKLEDNKNAYDNEPEHEKRYDKITTEEP
jgi:hypothetical protein